MTWIRSIQAPTAPSPLMAVPGASSCAIWRPVPLLRNGASLGGISVLIGALPATALAQSYDVLRAQTKKIGEIIDAPEDVLDVFDFEPAAC